MTDVRTITGVGVGYIQNVGVLDNSNYTPAQRSWKGGILESGCPSVRLWTQPRYRSPGCNSSPIAVKLDRDVPWVKISDEFVHGRRGSLNERISS